MSRNLLLASHDTPDAYWTGEHYTLNMSFGALRKRQWERLMQVLWIFPALQGPFAAAYPPPQFPNPSEVTIPSPRSERTWYGNLDIEGLGVGCVVQASRLKPPCVCVEVPLGMFEGLSEQDEEPLKPIQQLYQNLAQEVFKIRPFDLATIGFQRECPVMTDLLTDTRQWLSLLAKGNFFIRTEMLAALGYSAESFHPISPTLCWIEPSR